MTSRLFGHARHQLKLLKFRLRNRSKAHYLCPVCGYRGPFEDLHPKTGKRLHARCPNCRALERHRLQHLVMRKLRTRHDLASLSLLHIAPEPFMRQAFRETFHRYVTADLKQPSVDCHLNLCQLPFPDASFDVVYASHVLEHIPDDHRAMREIRRVLRSTGFAVLPVPIVAASTVEYPQANPHESYHVRAPGPDYIERMREHFARVELFDSGQFDAVHQLYNYEDRTGWPTPMAPLRPSMAGERHVDLVPVCYATCKAP